MWRQLIRVFNEIFNPISTSSVSFRLDYLLETVPVTNKYIEIVKVYANNQKKPPELFYEKGVLKNFPKFTGKHLCKSLFFNKVAGLVLEFLFK